MAFFVDFSLYKYFDIDTNKNTQKNVTKKDTNKFLKIYFCWKKGYTHIKYIKED